MCSLCNGTGEVTHWVEPSYNYVPYDISGYEGWQTYDCHLCNGRKRDYSDATDFDPQNDIEEKNSPKAFDELHTFRREASSEKVSDQERAIAEVIAWLRSP